ncbi:hypothetical protein LAZ40_03250 [Cereibacter sphaeroides]|uniref:hypothetical protein n=1 Tax=Cereibacter sphaeroides TaxID=1063 RepID=UPI001F22EDB6|nr:hypothetical protein [Cereibacter sphaeroides]MCE6958072.1 hypothetical protein [Cereibacter sphaeroides]MCE6971317.1 hypothetical protein [Cereibacter sphaeroides]
MLKRIEDIVMAGATVAAGALLLFAAIVVTTGLTLEASRPIQVMMAGLVVTLALAFRPLRR